MSYINEDLFFDEGLIDIYDSEWIRSSIQTVDSINYTVYQGLGDSSLVKLLINQDIVSEI